MDVYTSHKPKVEIVSDAVSLARRALDVFVSEASKAICDRGKFYVAISGGYTPRHFFELLGDDASSVDLAWDKIELFWTDERVVGVDSELSNYKLAVDTFLGKVGIAEVNVHRIPTEESNPELSAHNYEETLRRVFGLEGKDVPRFDLIILGLGADGHTCSLFPNSYAPFESEDLACVVYLLDDTPNRITVTHPVLCAAGRLVVLVSGEEKAEILKDVLTSGPEDVRYPIHVLWPVLERVTWLVDGSAARLL